MYWEYFGFEENPFSLSPDPRYLYMSNRHQEALAHLVYGISEAGGFVLLSGEVGTGKTTICRSLVEQLPDNVDLAFVLNPRLSDIELLATICDEMGVAYPRSEPSLKVLIDRLNEHLLRAHAIGRQPVLLIDEAQNLDPSVLEQIRLLTNLETNKRKLLQIVLIGQPELNELLAQPGLRQLDQRITARYHLRPLTTQETAGYIRHRLQVGGAPGDIFSDSAIRSIHRATDGIPRLINTLCDRCLLGAYAENKRKVDAKLVRGAAKEILRPRAPAPAKLAAPGLFAAVAAAAAFLLVDPLNLSRPATVATATVAEITTEEPHSAQAPDALANPVLADAAIGGGTDLTLQFRQVAAAEINTLPVLAGQTDKPDAPDGASVAAPIDAAMTGIDTSYPLPPPPPLPANVNADARAHDSAGDAWAPTPPPSSAPSEIGVVKSALSKPTADMDRDALGSSASLNLDLGEMTAVPGTSSTVSDAATSPSLGGVRDAGANTASESTQQQAATGLAEERIAEQPLQVAVLTPAPSSQAISEPSESPDRSALRDALAAADRAGDFEAALHTLFGMWGYSYDEMSGLSPCRKARFARLRCMQGLATWGELRVANRPAIITLSAERSPSHYVVLTRLDGTHAQIMLGDGTLVETKVSELSQIWAGDYLLLWRPPVEFSRELRPGVRGDDVLWLRDRMTSLGWTTDGAGDEFFYDDSLQNAVQNFQRLRGLDVDGVAGPRTILQVNAALGTSEAPTIR